MTKIIWFSRHSPLPSQVEELKRIFGPDACVVTDGRPFHSAYQIAAYMTEGAGDHMVVVASTPVLHDLCSLGFKPLVAVMESQGKTRNGTRNYKHTGFQRIVSMTMETEDL